MSSYPYKVIASFDSAAMLSVRGYIRFAGSICSCIKWALRGAFSFAGGGASAFQMHVNAERLDFRLVHGSGSPPVTGVYCSFYAQFTTEYSAMAGVCRYLLLLVFPLMISKCS